MQPMTSPPFTLKSMIGKLRHPFGAGKPADMRGGRVVAVIDCMLNQNVRDAGAARFPALNFDLVRLCQEQGVGIVQMPCPEIAVLGFERTRRPGQSIRDALDTEAGRAACACIAVETARRIEACIAAGCRPMAVLGGNLQSPGCAVHAGDGGLAESSGVFMKELRREFDRRGWTIPFKGLRDHDPKLLAQDIAWVCQLFESPPDAHS